MCEYKITITLTMTIGEMADALIELRTRLYKQGYDPFRLSIVEASLKPVKSKNE